MSPTARRRPPVSPAPPRARARSGGKPRLGRPPVSLPREHPRGRTARGRCAAASEAGQIGRPVATADSIARLIRKRRHSGRGGRSRFDLRRDRTPAGPHSDASPARTAAYCAPGVQAVRRTAISSNRFASGIWSLHRRRALKRPSILVEHVSPRESGYVHVVGRAAVKPLAATITPTAPQAASRMTISGRRCR